MARIFISSTYSDLKKFRDKVRSTVRKMGHQEVAMEDFSACDQKSLDECLDKIKQCDVYIGILGWNYGSRPPRIKKSYTELEYLKAIETKKTRLLFLAKEDKRHSEDIADKRIVSLRRKAKKERLVIFFGNRDQLATEVAIAIHNHFEKRKARGYMITRGVRPYAHYTKPPLEPWELDTQGVEEVSTLREKLLKRKYPLKKPIRLKVKGTLFPCALLTAGWWERPTEKKISISWKNAVQKWLFSGFDLWAPSWDYSWNLDSGQTDWKKPFYIAQLGSGDEADSLPVIFPRSKAIRLREVFLDKLESGVEGVEAEITGLLGRRDHFRHVFGELDFFGGLLDYCLWIDAEDKHHEISLLREKTDLYSGYLWKCLAPRGMISLKEKLDLSDVYFVWEHTNFAQKDAIKYNLDGLIRKEKYIQSKFGHNDLVLIAKSSPLVPGIPIWEPQEIYNFLTNKKIKI